MAKTITQLPDATAVNDADELVIQQGGVTKRATAQELRNHSGDITIGDKIIHDGDTNTAIRFPAADTVTVETAGSERLRVDSSGKVGIGTNSPVLPLHINTSSGNAAIHLTTNSTGATLSDGFTLTCEESTNDAFVIQRENANLIFRTNDTERMRVDSGGNVLISRTTTAAGNSGWYFGPSGIARGEFTGGQVATLNRIDIDGTAIEFQRAGSGVGAISVTTTATTYSTSSDHRLKENASALTGGLSTVNQLSPVEFTWKSNGSLGRGFIAHELQSVIPEAVAGEKDAVDADGNPQYQGVDASKIVPYLVAAIKELSAKVEALEAAQQS